MTEQKNIVEIPVTDLLRVTPFKGRDDMRYYLNGVLITPYQDHALLVATNGHWMAIYESTEARTDKDRILELPEWFVQQINRLQYCKSLEYDPGPDDMDLDDEDDGPRHRTPAIGLKLIVESESSRLTISSYKEELAKPGAPFIDGKFVDWKKVLPDPVDIAPGLTQPFSAQYLGNLHKAVPQEYGHPLFCYHWRDQPEKCGLFRFGNMPQLVLALMPRRDKDCEPESWPQWMNKDESAKVG